MGKKKVEKGEQEREKASVDVSLATEENGLKIFLLLHLLFFAHSTVSVVGKARAEAATHIQQQKNRSR